MIRVFPRHIALLEHDFTAGDPYIMAKTSSKQLLSIIASISAMTLTVSCETTGSTHNKQGKCYFDQEQSGERKCNHKDGSSCGKSKCGKSSDGKCGKGTCGKCGGKDKDHKDHKKFKMLTKEACEAKGGRWEDM